MGEEREGGKMRRKGQKVRGGFMSAHTLSL